jgi:hypothetical protein
MALRMYRCVLLRAERAGGRFIRVDQFTCELDLDPGMGHTIRAALLDQARQHGGQDADISQYRLNVLDLKNNRTHLPDFAAPPETAAGSPAGPLADCTDDQLISELARRLRRR